MESILKPVDTTSFGQYQPEPSTPPPPAPTDYHNFKTVGCRLEPIPVLDAEDKETGVTEDKIVPYQLDDVIAADLKKFADPDCYRCHGGGIRDWRQQGVIGRVCPCCKRSDD